MRGFSPRTLPSVIARSEAPRATPGEASDVARRRLQPSLRGAKRRGNPACGPAGPLRKQMRRLRLAQLLFSWRASRAAELPRRFAPRNDGWGKRRLQIDTF